ncbi:MAG: hypothetical protein JWL88_570 [Parcubacteria group bacterium]|nr:hypothetical protein [Parcubacteria group bacterium]
MYTFLMGQAFALIAFAALLAWIVFGHPLASVYGAFWPNAPAPWENVIGYYYPDKANYSYNPKMEDTGTLAQCRTWAAVTIAASQDPDGQASDYLCGIGCKDPKNPSTCRATVK